MEAPRTDQQPRDGIRPPPPPNMMPAAPPPPGMPAPSSYAGPYGPHAEPHFPAEQAAHWFPGGDPAYDFDDDADAETEGRDAKRRRIARACDMCRKKKIKCDGQTPKCSHCLNYKTECIFTQVEKKRAPPKGAKYIEGLENRLGRMENLLRLSGLLAEDDRGRTDLGTLEKRLTERQTGSSGSSPVAQETARVGPSQDQQRMPTNGTPQDYQHDVISPTPAAAATAAVNDVFAARSTSSPRSTTATHPPKDPFKRDPKEVDALADQMCSLITNNCGETRYIGSSSGFSIFSPKGIQWVNEKTGDASFQSMISSASGEEKHGWDHWKPEVFNDLFERRLFKPLPGRQECYALLKDYFEHFNQMFPLFHEPTFMHLVDKHYSLEPYEGSGWWASLNVALAIAHRLRVMSNVVGQEEDEHAWGYLKNAMAVMTELAMRNTDLLSVQALLGMALFLQGTPNPQPSFFLVAAAIRLAHSIGLHKRGSGFNLNELENEQRKRVFWIAYLLDKDICLRSGRPPSQDDDDMNVELPSEDPPDNVGNVPLASPSPAPSGKPKTPSGGVKKSMNLFRLMCTFAQIQSRVYKHLYSVRASRQSDGELLNTIGALDSELETWKDSIPLDFRPEHPINAAHTPLILHVVCLHFAYYNCLTTIHRMSVHHGYWTSRLSDYAIQGLNARPLNPRVFMSAALCVNAARTSIGLVRYIPQGDYACVWLVLYYPVSALVTLFANILQNPQDTRARSDLKLMSSVVSFLTMLERDVNEANGNVRRMLSVCAEFERIARVVLDKAERDLRSGRGKRKGPGTGTGTGSGGERPTERERQKEMRARGEAEKLIAEGLEAGKTLEQMQVETQAAYRRPVQTPSLRASIAWSAQGSPGVSPASWGGSQLEGVGAEYRSPAGMSRLDGDGEMGFPPPPPQQQQQGHHAKDASTSAGPFILPNGEMVDFHSNGHPTSRSPALHHQPAPANFSQPQSGLTDGYNNPAGVTGLSRMSNNSAFVDSLLMPSEMNGGGNGGNGFLSGMSGMGGTAGSFQQPFVPQDLWQMPMTLEWDWAEGLAGLGSFTPGGMGMGMFDGDGGGGVEYMGDTGGGGGVDGQQ